MADNFCMVNEAPAAGVTKIRQWSLAWREMVLAGVGLALLVVCIVLAILYGTAKRDQSEQRDNVSVVMDQRYCIDQSCLQATSRTMQLMKTSVDSCEGFYHYVCGNYKNVKTVSYGKDQQYCIDQSCLQATSRIMQLMNTSVDPCEDFYHYACGNYKNARTISYGKERRRVIGDIYLDNEDKLRSVLESPVHRAHEGSAEKKLKDFFKSCKDLFSREKLLGTPFLEKVVPALGGWDLLGTWKEAEWDFNTALKKVQGDFWTKAIYRTDVRVGRANRTVYGISMRPAGAGRLMRWNWYRDPGAQKYRDHYQKFIRRVASLLMRDAKVTFDSATQAVKLDQFVKDIFTIESHIAYLASYSHYSFDPYEEASKITLDDLNAKTNNVINWVDQLSYLFNEATVTGSTEVELYSHEYFMNMTKIITDLPDTDRKRILHNYLIWRVAEIYSQDMSWEYFHARREILHDIYGRAFFPEVEQHCFNQMSKYMADALGAVFIWDHFADTNRQQVKDITEYLKTALQEQIDLTTWMDAETKAYAKDKLEATSFKIGYPDWMANHTSVDSLYNSLTVNVSDYFGTVLSANVYFRSQLSRELMHGDDRHRWNIEIYGVRMANAWNRNEVTASAGILQKPIYDYTQPHYNNFGSLGGLLGQYLHHVVDDFGRRYDKEGNNLGRQTWWTYNSLLNYDPLWKCVAEVYRNATNAATYPDGQQRLPGGEVYSYAPRAIATINGLRLAIQGYRKWVSDRGTSEKMLLGLNLTDDQMVFLSYAQTACYITTDYWASLFASGGSLDGNLQVNIAMSQLPEFAKAFKCSKTAKLNSVKKCDYQ